MRLIDADHLLNGLQEAKENAKNAHSRAGMNAYNLMIELLNRERTVNPICFDCETVLIGDYNHAEENKKSERQYKLAPIKEYVLF